MHEARPIHNTDFKKDTYYLLASHCIQLRRVYELDVWCYECAYTFVDHSASIVMSSTDIELEVTTRGVPEFRLAGKSGRN